MVVVGDALVTVLHMYLVRPHHLSSTHVNCKGLGIQQGTSIWVRSPKSTRHQEGHCKKIP